MKQSCLDSEYTSDHGACDGSLCECATRIPKVLLCFGFGMCSRKNHTSNVVTKNLSKMTSLENTMLKADWTHMNLAQESTAC
jgi:hypothetical protein